LIVRFKGTPQNPLSHLEVEEKARTLTRGILSERQLERLFESVHRLEKIPDVSRIGDFLRSGG
jgi:hypothetical protein